jgi:hypothetical protein
MHVTRLTATVDEENVRTIAAVKAYVEAGKT